MHVLIVGLITLVVYTKTMTLEIVPKKTTIIGHRGACAYAPENTISSIKKALTFHVPMIEFDVHQCVSGEVVVIHDVTVDRTTNGHGFVDKLSYTQLRSLTIENGEHIPTLQEVLDTINRQAVAVIELKGLNTARPVATIIRQYITQKGWSYSDFLVVSFDHTQLQTIHDLLPKLPIGPTCYGLPANPIRYTQSLSAQILSLHPAYVTADLIGEAHKHGIKIYLWHENSDTDKQLIQQAVQYGADGVFADAPDKPLSS